MKKEMKKKKRKLIDGPANGLKFVKLHCFPVEVKLLGTLYSVHQAGGETCGVPEEQGWPNLGGLVQRLRSPLDGAA